MFDNFVVVSNSVILNYKSINQSINFISGNKAQFRPTQNTHTHTHTHPDTLLSLNNDLVRIPLPSKTERVDCVIVARSVCTPAFAEAIIAISTRSLSSLYNRCCGL